jgi:hypothetical protein
MVIDRFSRTGKQHSFSDFVSKKFIKHKQNCQPGLTRDNGIFPPGLRGTAEIIEISFAIEFLERCSEAFKIKNIYLNFNRHARIKCIYNRGFPITE